MLFSQLKEEEKRSICKKEIENLENWLRRLAHELLSKEYGKNYLEYKDGNNNYLISRKIMQEVKSRLEQESERFPRCIDAFFLSDLIYIICRDDLYNKFFKDPLSKAFPDGNNEARTFLERLVDPRNALSHAHPISNRKAEQVVCYCHDIIDSIKEYYFKMGTEHEFNVPSIIKITDSFGNSIHSHEIKERSPFIWELDDDRKNYLFPGDNLGIEIEIDPSFEPSSYTIEWIIKNEYIEKYNNKTRISFKLGVKHVGELCIVKCKIISNKNWHKHNTYDDKISIFYKVLPPLNDH
ncbi:MAG TPA: hypothetical protein VFD10_08550 [Atribacterota bacterium]|nr:hypothetical protein [Atribacterota bacterium]